VPEADGLTHRFLLMTGGPFKNYETNPRAPTGVPEADGWTHRFFAHDGRPLKNYETNPRPPNLVCQGEESKADRSY
jgi:hypothetical protein